MSVSRNLHPAGFSVGNRIMAIALILLYAACGQVQLRENGLVFADWYIVKPLVESGVTTAYGKVTNTQNEATTLSAVSLDCAQKAELHETIESGDRVSMLGLDSITIPAGATIAFEPGKKHLMISGLRMPDSGKCTATITVAGRNISFAIPVKERRD
jgi:copper(I)-binding protein